MRRLPFPLLDHENLYCKCINQVSNATERNRLRALTNSIVQAGIAYRQAGEDGTLHNVVPLQIKSADRALVRELYSKRMVPKSGAGRYAYDEIHSSSDYCPYCSYGEIYELDHFLPKEPFCDLNVLPLNLLPICHPCNNIKRQKRPENAQDGFLHPYFDHLPQHERWLFADLTIQHGGPMLSYRVDLDEGEYGDLARRLDYHFRELKLESRFRRQAAAVLLELEAEVSQKEHELNSTQISAHLRDRALQFAERNLNSLETAAYYAASCSDEYCAGEFRN